VGALNSKMISSISPIMTKIAESNKNKNSTTKSNNSYSRRDRSSVDNNNLLNESSVEKKTLLGS
jgi:hypothetical protein